jgi:hypothetical protein
VSAALDGWPVELPVEEGMTIAVVGSVYGYMRREKWQDKAKVEAVLQVLNGR